METAGQIQEAEYNYLSWNYWFVQIAASGWKSAQILLGA